ncbi:hypothetical protein AYI86_13730 [Shewanella algae]|nr:hypothetical protein AYI86_13730 [Shewanella algae]
MNGNEVGKWVHPAFAATSMAFFLTILDKEQLVSSSWFLIFCVYFYGLALFFNSIWSFLYYVLEDEDINNKIRSNCFLKLIDNFTYWSFIFPTISLILYIFIRTFQVIKIL